MAEVLPENSFPERVRTLVKAYGSKEKLAQAVGISAVMIGKYESGSEPSRDKLVALAEATGVSIEWLVSGRGEMKTDVLLAPHHGQSSAHVKEPPPCYVRDEDQLGLQLSGQGAAHRDLKPEAQHRRGDDAYCYIPLYDVKASAGGGELVERENVLDFLSFKAEWIRTALHASPADLYLIHVDGESMEPTLRPGDVILVDHREAPALPRDGIYVMRMDGTLLVKRLQRLPGGVVRVTSDNEAYQPFTVSLADAGHGVDIVGRVVWCGRRM